MICEVVSPLSILLIQFLVAVDFIFWLVNDPLVGTYSFYP